MLKRRKSTNLQSAWVGAILLFFTLTPSTYAAEVWQQEFHLPWVSSFTGPLSPWVKEAELGLQVAVDGINSIGGIAGKKVILKPTDVASKPAEAVLRIREVAPKSLVIMGPVTSTDGATGGPAAARDQVPWFGGGTTGPTWCTKDENRPWTWMQYMSNEKTGTLAPKLLVPKLPKMKNIFVIQETKEKAAIGQWNGAEEELKRLGIEIIGRATTALGDVDFTAQVTKAVGAHPDAIWLGCYTSEAGGVIKELRKQGWKGLICTIQSPVTPEIVRIAGEENLNGVLTAMDYYALAPEPLEAPRFTKIFKEKHGRSPGSVAPIMYDTLYVIKDIFESQKLTYNPNQLKEERLKFIKAMAGKKWKGASGNITWNNDGTIEKQGYPLIFKGGELYLYN